MRNRSMALVVRDNKILMIHTYRFNRYIFRDIVLGWGYIVSYPGEE